MLDPRDYQALLQAMEEARARSGRRTAWRIEGTLREFPRFKPVNVWFDYPVHRLDQAGCLQDVDAESETPPWKRGKEARAKQGKQVRRDQAEETVRAIQACNFGNPPTLEQLMDYLSIAERTARDRLKQCKDYMIDKNSGTIVRRV